MGGRVRLVATGAAVGLPGDTMVGALVTGASDGPGVTMPELIGNTSKVVPSVVTYDTKSPLLEREVIRPSTNISSTNVTVSTSTIL